MWHVNSFGIWFYPVFQGLVVEVPAGWVQVLRLSWTTRGDTRNVKTVVCLGCPAAATFIVRPAS